MAEIITLPIARRPRIPLARPLDGRVAIVTGSTRGIGLGIASALAAEGAMIVLNGSGSEPEIDNLRHVLGARHDVAVRHDDADMNDGESIAAMVTRTERTFGSVDILVNNDCTRHAETVGLLPEREPVAAVFHASWAVLPEMKRRGWGRIVNITSTGPACGTDDITPEHDVIGLTRTIALNGNRRGVTCNALCLVQLAADPVQGNRVSNQPVRDCATVLDIARVVSFLCGPGGGAISGAALPIDVGSILHSS